MGDNNKNSGNGLDVIVGQMFLHRDQWKECGRRVPRAELEPTIHSVWITLRNLSPVPMSVRTIGELGAYCLRPEGPKLVIDRDHMVDVGLQVENERYHFEGRIRYVQEDGFALEFVNPPEYVRQKIRTFLEPELLATTLAPYVSYTTMEPGSTGALIYSDGEFNRLQIALVDDKVLAVHLDLEILDTHMIWRKSDRKKTGDFIGQVTHLETQKKLLSFVRNLPGLTVEFFKEIESILMQGRVS